MQENTRISPYEYVPGAALTEEIADSFCKVTKEQIEKLFKDQTYRRTEYALMEALYRLPYLTRKNMEIFADNRLKDRRYAGYEKMIKKLWEDGCLRRFNYEGTRFYQLSDAAREYMAKKLDEKQLHQIKIPNQTPEEVLECAALGQWHLSVLRSTGIRKSYFCESVKIKKQETFVPSYIELDKNKYLYKVLSFSVPRAAANMSLLIDNISEVRDRLQKWTPAIRKEIYLIVMVCTSTHEMEKLTEILKSIPATEKMPIYFVAETNTTFSKGLDLLYRYQETENGNVLKTISVQ